MNVLSLLLAVLAAGCNAVSSVFQRKANKREGERRRFGVRLLLKLVRQPVWLVGVLAMIGSFLLQASALSIGTLTAVEPVLVLELPATLVLGAWVLHHPLRRRDWLGAVAMAAGLALMIAVLAPTGGDAQHTAPVIAVLATGAALTVIATLLLIGRFGPRGSRAALFGAASGSGFGLAASLMKMAMSALMHGGAVGLLTAWETYGAVVAGVGSVVLVQAALHAGTLVAAQPGITLLDPAVSILWGILVLGETVRQGPILVLAVLGAAIIAAAALALIRATQRAHTASGQ